jgi:pimeloyl-ACP methyl ester carboxylesterase
LGTLNWVVACSAGLEGMRIGAADRQPTTAGGAAAWQLAETRGGMRRRNRRYFTLARRAPALSRAACWLWARLALAGLGGNRDRLVRRLSKALPPTDREVLAKVAADPGRSARFVDDSAEAFRQGGAGVRADLAVASRPWGLERREVTVPTWLWHGTADQEVPIGAARHLAQTIPSCRATFTDEAPHEAAPRQRGRRVYQEGDRSLVGLCQVCV